MAAARTYSTAKAFRTALEERLKRTAQADGMDLNRLRRQVSFDRLLARLFHSETVPWVLKGGYSLELRFKNARATVDIDLTLQRVPATTMESSGINAVVQRMLQSATETPVNDGFEFAIGSPVMDLTAAPCGGACYPVETRMAERTFTRFHLDAGIG